MDIYFFGDSISFGQGISIDRVWVTKIAEKLHKELPDKEMFIEYLNDDRILKLLAYDVDIISHKLKNGLII